jgi:D-alanyl-D-alanine carboxypeptidase
MVAAVLVLTAYGARAETDNSTWFSGFSQILVDAKTGEVITSSKADELRHPASLAKIMTLYLLFAELEAGRLKLASEIRVSAEAASQPPSKLGLKPGETIKVEDAIKALVTRSANDVAVAVAEVIAGDEPSFAKLMTRRARVLGMSRTVFTNASGLPDSDQVTTAREMALLALALQDRFPKYYPYFATRVFHWRGVAIGNHNRLLGAVDGVDGIKTGYTRASGFNLVTNAKRNNRHVVAVVMGGRTGPARDELMRDLIAENIQRAHAGARTAPRFVEAPASTPVSSPATTAAIRPVQPGAGSTEPVRRMAVQTVSLDKDGERVAARPKSEKVLPISNLSATSVREPAQVTPTALAPSGKIVTFAPPPAPATVASASAQDSPEIERAKVVSSLLPEEALASGSVEAPTRGSVIARQPQPAPGNWYIQIGAFGNEAQARERLATARELAASLLAKVNSYTEKGNKGSTEFYRARFAGFDEASAKRACETLKKNEFSCFAARN